MPLLSLWVSPSDAGSRIPDRAAQYSTVDQASIRVMSFNTQNFFNGRFNNGRVSFEKSRGPRDQQSYQQKKAALVRLVQQVQPDILALQEVENDTRFARPAILDLTKALGDNSYKLVSFAGQVRKPYGTDAITQFILYKPSSTLKPVGTAKSFSWSNANVGRPLVMQKFEFSAAGTKEFFCVANSHLKSRRNTCGGDRNCTLKRVKQAKAFNFALQGQKNYCGSILWVGDFNAEPHHQTLKLLRSANWQSLLDESAYSYTFRGKKILLDHALWLGEQPFIPMAQVIHQSRTFSDHAPVVVDLVLPD